MAIRQLAAQQAPWLPERDFPAAPAAMLPRRFVRQEEEAAEQEVRTAREATADLQEALQGGAEQAAEGMEGEVIPRLLLRLPGPRAARGSAEAPEVREAVRAEAARMAAEEAAAPDLRQTAQQEQEEPVPKEPNGAVSARGRAAEEEAAVPIAEHRAGLPAELAVLLLPIPEQAAAGAGARTPQEAPEAAPLDSSS